MRHGTKRRASFLTVVGSGSITHPSLPNTATMATSLYLFCLNNLCVAVIRRIAGWCGVELLYVHCPMTVEDIRVLLYLSLLHALRPNYLR